MSMEWLDRVARDFPLGYRRVFWLLPLLPLIIVTDLTALLWLGGTALILLVVRDSRAPTFSWIYRNWWTSFAIGALAGVAIHFLIDPLVIPLAERATGSALDLSMFAEVQGDPGEFMELLIVALVFGGIIEEICFRGFFIGWGVKLFGKRSAIPLILLISVVFGIGHWYQGPAGAIVTGVSSIVFGLVYTATGFKLLPAVAAHMSANFLGVLDLYLHGP